MLEYGRSYSKQGVDYAGCPASQGLKPREGWFGPNGEHPWKWMMSLTERPADWLMF